MAVATNQPDGTVLMPENEAVTEAVSIIDELQAQLVESQKETKKAQAKVTQLEGKNEALTTKVTDLEAQLAQAKSGK